ncbi:phosphotransferase enzyme family protein [Maribacter sp. HTCC2170]|uniref:phosphotransferase enzyme family protein n=1 Tax=Maribacter sp. (strain HTCC2170 / KCCM 42371) TaxID=313603 RepID=UPI001ED96EE1|nr:aminoglycoside phosphotransferase family protein [Maribacter sp. HTCC2170]
MKGETFQFTSINNGYINDTYMVFDDGKPQYILQRINHNVFKDIDGLMSNIFHALKELDSDDYRKIDLIKSLSDKSYYDDENGYWRLMSFIDNSTTYNITKNQKIAFEAGRIIGRFHQILEHTNIDNYVDTIPDFHNLELREKQFNSSKIKADSEKLMIAKNAISFAQETLLKLHVLGESSLPPRICHNDTKLNNILFSKSSDRALCLIDLDTIMKGYFYYDFGDAVRTIVNTAAEDEKELHKITFERDLFNAFVDGIAANGAFLSQEEIRTLSLGTVFMPFIHGLRALTDYLNNNIYYKVAYENQNFDRCLSLFDFTHKALNEVDFMERTILEKLG